MKDLEVELETTKEKSKENLQQALSLEKERVTKMQWDMEELRRRSLEFELQLKSQVHFLSNFLLILQLKTSYASTLHNCLEKYSGCQVASRLHEPICFPGEG